jgi:CheY-like chemotaxis protein
LLNDTSSADITPGVLAMATVQGSFDTVESAVLGPGVVRARRPLVLLVGDDESALSVCAERLESVSIQVATARTGFEAIVKASWHLPDAIAIQDGLSASEGVDGSVAAQLLRICPVTAHIPITSCVLSDPALVARLEQQLS